MTAWTDRFDDHRLNQVINDVDTGLEELKKEPEDTPEFIEARNRLVQIQELLRQKLDEIDPNLIAGQHLDAMAVTLEHELTEISNFLGNKNVDHLMTANEHADALLATLGQLFIPLTPEDFQGIRESVASFRQSVGQYSRAIRDEIEGLENQIGPLEGRLTELQSVIDAQRSRLDESIAEFQRQFSEAESNRSERFASAESSRDAEYRAATTESESGFRDLVDSQDQEFKTLLEASQVELSELKESLVAESQDTLETLEEHKERAQRLVYIIADTGMAGGYQRVADEERNLARRWQLGTAVSLIGLIISAIVLFISTLYVDISLEVFLARAFVTGTFGVFAGYSARQASRHAEIERYNRRMELEIASIEPYLEKLPPDIQNAIKEDFAKKVFGREAEPSLDYSEQTTGSMFELAKMLADTIAQLAKR